MLKAVCDFQPEYFKINSKVMEKNGFDFKVKSIPEDSEESFDIKVILRPHLKEVLRLLKKQYNLAVFTASKESYAAPILDKIEEEESLFSYRLFRESCLIPDTR